VYFARPDSIIDNISVHKARMRMGEKLAEKIARLKPDHDIDVVIPIPDTSRTSALQLALALGIKYREGFVKNRYIGRTFIMPSQQSRRNSIRRKLNPIPLEFEGKDVLLVDDSIVRGNTAARIVQMARDAGAKKVYLASCSPPLIAPCPYGIDMATKREFVATNKTNDEIAKHLGVDGLIYLDREAMNQAARVGNPKIEKFCNACFTGEYPTGDITVERMTAIEGERLSARDEVGCSN
jgi:amidophosphoribosyltransferase